VSFRLLYLIFIRVCGWRVLPGRSSASKNADLLVVWHEAAVLRRALRGPSWTGPAARPRRADPVPLGNTIQPGQLRVLGGSGGVRVFVDQAIQDGPSVDPCGVEVGHGGAGRVTICVGDMLGDAWCGLAVGCSASDIP
jgi:hypothetical protein